MEHGPSLALPPPEEDAARASAEEAGKVKEREGVEKDEKEEKGLMTPTRSTTGPPGSATGPTTEMEVFLVVVPSPVQKVRLSIQKVGR